MNRALLLALVICLSGCDPFSSPDKLLETYNQRLSRVLDVDPGPVNPLRTPRYPAPRDRQLEIPEIEVSLLRFLSLYGCDLQVVVGERNAILGRVMQPLNKLRYDLRFIRSAQRCLPAIENENIRQDIAAALDHKQTHILEQIWNASFATPEMADFMRRSQGFYPLTSSPQSLTTLVGQLRAFEQFVQAVKADDWQQRPSMLADLQQNWQQQATAGQLIRSAEAIISKLNQGTAMLRTRVDARPMCFQKKLNPQAERLHGVFLSVYIAEVQPYLSSVSRASNVLFHSLADVNREFESVMPKSFTSYAATIYAMQGPTSLWQRLDDSIEAHTQAWQDLLSQCGLRPGENR